MTRDSKCGFPFNDDDKAVARADLRIGAIMPDGTIYAGISPRTDTPMYVMPQDAPLTMTFKKANAAIARTGGAVQQPRGPWWFQLNQIRARRPLLVIVATPLHCVGYAVQRRF